MHAEHDAYVLPVYFSRLERYMPNATVLQLDGASHWLLDEFPRLVSQHIRDFLAAGPKPTSRLGRAHCGRVATNRGSRVLL